MSDHEPRPTERHHRCAHCKVPRFLAASRGCEGTLRIKCPKCRHEAVFVLHTGEQLSTVPARAQERELRCGGCTWFIAGVHVTQGEGYVRVQCPRPECKRPNRFACSVTEASVIEVPVG
ncbi:MAG: hypothetical protein Q8Q14_14800 [Gemmatimonadales bacterium]|nr:hypothetical protein [Gemmatimonadales bacterium]